MKPLIKNSKFKILLSNNVFKPTGTSDLLYQTAAKFIKKPSRILDLGCGSGYVGIAIKKNLPLKSKFFFSDLSKYAVQLTKKNLKLNKISGNVRCGSLFVPWKNIKFDFIVNDVTGIAKEISTISPWYNKKIPTKSGKDGTELTIKFITESKEYLNKKGKIFFPLISLSNYKKVLKVAKKNYNSVKLINSKEWPLPQEMYKFKKQIEKLHKKKIIYIKKKFGMIIFKTDIYSATK